MVEFMMFGIGAAGFGLGLRYVADGVISAFWAYMQYCAQGR